MPSAGFRSCTLAVIIPLPRTKESVSGKRLYNRALQLTKPRYRNVYYHKREQAQVQRISFPIDHPLFVETKNTWARDDPAILILLFGCLLGEGIV